MRSPMGSDYRKLIIIGAPRSGTNMLRDALCSLAGFATWQCDEINAIWKHGFTRYKYDDLSPAWVQPTARAFVRKAFDDVAHRSRAEFVVEKTCANSLRAKYVSELLPEAWFIFLYRDGGDAVASAHQRWTSSFEVGYVAKKVRFVPIGDLPAYAGTFLRTRYRQFFDTEGRVNAWGPMTKHVRRYADEGNVLSAAAIQWSNCVDAALNDFADIPRDRVLRCRYESFVRNPVAGLGEILDFLDVDRPGRSLHGATGRVRATSVGRGRTMLARNGKAAEVGTLINSSLDSLRYPRLPAVPSEP